mgnify:CR=1 FL=1
MVENNLSIIVPIFEKKVNFITFYENVKLSLSKYNFIDYIFVDDGNDYDLKQIVDKDIKNIKIINNNKNLGYGASIKKGVEAANNEFLGIIDSDNSYDLDHLINLFEVFKESKCDLLVGKRDFKYKDNFFKIAFRKIINFLSSWIFNCKIEDINSGLRIFNRSDFIKDKNIYSDKFSLSSTQTLCTVSRDKTIKYVDTNYLKRDGSSKINILKDPFRFIYLIFKIFLIFSPMKFFGSIGVFFILSSFLILIFSIIFLQNILDTTFLMLFIAGINFVFFGLIGEIIRIYNK